MMNKQFLGVLIMIFFISCSQEPTTTVPSEIGVPIVKQQATFEVAVTENITYAEGLSHDTWNSATASAIPLLMDAYLPVNDEQNRPLLLLIHGGGFTGGSKQQQALVDMANYYASRSFAVFSIDYRLYDDKGTIPQQWIDATADMDPQGLGQLFAIYPAHRDAKAALRFIVANAVNYHINTNYITVGGGSAGAITSIGLGVSELEDFKSEISLSQDYTLSTTNLSQTYEVHTIIDLWGSSVSIDILEVIYGYQRFDSDDPAIFIAHGTKDTTVPFSSAEDLKTICETTPIDFVYYPLQGRGHGPWGATVNGKSLFDLSFDFIVESQGLTVR